MRWPLLLLTCSSLFAVDAPSGPIMQAIMKRFQTAKMNLMETAELMPAADYEYKLTPPQRSFSNWIAHTLEMNYGTCKSISSQPAPDYSKFHHSTDKTELVAGFKASFDYCEQAFSAFNDETAVKAKTVGTRQVYPVDAMFGLVVNWNQHYGNLVGYLRTKGLVPPSTSRAQSAKK